MATPLETFTAGVAAAVDVAKIERQLRELWQLAAQSENQQITRACLFNLIAYTESDAGQDHATKVISTLTSRHPCRAIVLQAEPDRQPAELSASITAHCHLAGGGRKQVCCEQISIRAAGKSVAHLATAVLPLLESDLPAVLWWPGDFLAHPTVFVRLAKVVDRVIFDTSIAAMPLREVAATLARHPQVSFMDLSWTRLALWRRMVAEAFEDATCCAALPDVNAIEVVHGKGPGARLRGLLLASWVAAQLGWSTAVEGRQIQLRRNDNKEAAELGLLSVALRGEGFEVEAHKDHGKQTATAQVHLANACGLPRTRAFWTADDAALLSQELDHLSPHEIYARALALAGALENAFLR